MSVLENKTAENMIMDQNNNIQLFEDKRIRTAWDEEEQG
jgi:hypothetical protein